MHVISRKKLREFATQHADAGDWLDTWFYTVNKARWFSIEDVHEVYASADVVGKWTVFNVRGNHYRLITEINYMKQRVYIRHVLTHAEYDRGRWKRET
ncbi:MAG TPA: type II toxin-antitoxin system HigB family toxin [Thermomicrobiales bacterium]|nr:type II toxin-antitoxin system HigB family toxin [Thermomicrobiales bacterium]